MVHWLENLQFFLSLPYFPKFVWKSKHGQEVLMALGKMEPTELSENKYQVGGFLFENLDFRDFKDFKVPCSFVQGDDSFPWGPFATGFYEPEVIYSLSNSNPHAVKIHWKHPKATKEITSLFSTSPLSDHGTRARKPSCLSMTESPSFEEWEIQIQRILDLIKQNKLQKLALSRRKIFQFSKETTSLSMAHYFLDCWFKSKNNFFCEDEYFVLWQPQDEEIFLSRSPERLFKRCDQKIEIDALAATCPRGANEDEDFQLGRALLCDEKSLQEHRFVTEGILNSLSPLCKNLIVKSKEQLMKLTHVQHIHTSIQGELKENIASQDIMKAMHPTPAVGGLPQKISSEFIGKIEDYPRGPYAGVLGFITPDDEDFCVGLRCAHFHKNQMTVYAGAGIVQDSKILDEWMETENKMKHFINYI